VNGFEFAGAGSQIKPEIKILLMTRFDIDDTLLKMNMEYNNNLGGIIQKPVSSAKLARMIMAHPHHFYQNCAVFYIVRPSNCL
jgi:two-component SAPR family response regulator